MSVICTARRLTPAVLSNRLLIFDIRSGWQPAGALRYFSVYVYAIGCEAQSS